MRTTAKQISDIEFKPASEQAGERTSLPYTDLYEKKCAHR